MKLLFKNAALIFVLAGLIGFPSLGFGMMKFQPESPVVLGVAASPVWVEKQVVKVDGEKVGVVGEFNLNLNLSEENRQTFYDVVPEEYLGEDYEYYIVVPADAKEAGVSASVVSNGTSADLLLTATKEVPQTLSLTVLVLR